jgi:Raf kinase inhibitor-like YbhB/YbcL family protein
MGFKGSIIAAAGVSLTLSLASAAQAEGTFALTSSSFEDSAIMDTKFAGKGGPRNCPGENISPAFAWENPPEGTKSFIFLSHDDSGHRGMGVDHWVLYNIPAAANGFAEGEIPDGALQGPNITGRMGYQGPCPTPGENAHYYEFTLIATSLDLGHFEEGLTRDEILSQLEETAIAATSFVGRFGR